MEAKAIVIQCALLLAGRKNRTPKAEKTRFSLSQLKLTAAQLTELQALSCDELMLRGFSRALAFRKVQQALEQLA